MKFMLSIHGNGNNGLIDCLKYDLEFLKAEVDDLSGLCICEMDFDEGEVRRSMEGVDALIYHPSRRIRSAEGIKCVEAHRRIIEVHQDKRIYVFALRNPEIAEILGKRDNVRYISEKNTAEIMNEIIELARKSSGQY